MKILFTPCFVVFAVKARPPQNLQKRKPLQCKGVVICMIKEGFVITEFVTSFFAEDHKGRKTYFPNRRSACFIIPIRGKISFSGETGTVFADAAHPVFLPEGFSYINECLEDAESYVFNFKTKFPYQAPCVLRAVPRDVLFALYERIAQAEHVSALSSSLSIFESLYTLAGHLFAQGPAERQNEAVRLALAYMRRHYGKSTLTIGEIARAAHVSEIYLRKLFVKTLSVPPFKALTEIRMQRARLLIEEKRPLKEVAVCVGYGDVFQFSRAYKRYYGASPSQRKGVSS